MRGWVRDGAVGGDKDELAAWDCSLFVCQFVNSAMESWTHSKGSHPLVNLCRSTSRTFGGVVEAAKGSWRGGADYKSFVAGVDDSSVDLFD